MSLFSQRKGFKPLKKEFQREFADEELRNRLWSAIKVVAWDKWHRADFTGSYDTESRMINGLLDRIWLHYFKWPLDTRPDLHYGQPTGGGSYLKLREYFFKAKWYEMYDFIEFVVKNLPPKWGSELRDFCNNLLESENAAYRIVDDEVVEITDETEIEAIEDALAIKIQPIKSHLKRALELLSDKKEPDFRNSIKESISAVEACCQFIVGDSKATLGEALKKVNSSTPIHPALEKGFSSIYGYTSDSGGIRHALVDGDIAPSYADAKFMLVACSSFTNFLLTKAAESGIEISK